MSGLSSRFNAGSRAASSTKRKKGGDDDSFEYPSDDDSGHISVSSQNATDSIDDANDGDDSEEDFVEKPGRSSRQKNKNKVTKRSAKSKRAGNREQFEDDSNSSSPEGLKVERHAAVVRRRKRELKEQEKRLKAQKLKTPKVPMDVSDSSTEGNAGLPSMILAQKKGEAFQEGRDRAARRVARAMNKSVLDRDEQYPNGTAKEFRRLIPKPQYDEYWTEAQQSELEQRLSHDKDFQDQLKIREFVVSVWKTAYRFTGRLATDIIGPKTGLEFECNGKAGVMWTERFCDALTAIILHPMFHLDTEKMALALQWAIICRTGDKRKYKLTGCNDDPFLQKLVTIIDKHQDGSRTARDLREAASYEYIKARGTNAEPPTWSQFLGHIEKKALVGSGHSSGADGVEEGPYFVTKEDARAVRSALDRVKHLSLRKFADTRQVVDAVMPSRTKYDIPNTKLTQDAIKAVLLQKERNKQRYDDDQESGSSGDNAGLGDDLFAGGRTEAVAPMSATVSQGSPVDGNEEDLPNIAEAQVRSPSLGEQIQGSQPQDDDDFGFGYDVSGGFDELREILPSDSGDMDLDESFGPESAPDQIKSGSVGPQTSSSQGPGGSDEAYQVQPSEMDGGETRALSPWLLARSSRVCVRSLLRGSITIRHRNVQRHSDISSLRRPQIVPSIYPDEDEVEHHSSEAAVDALENMGRAARGAMQFAQLFSGQTGRAVLIDE